MRNRLDGQIYAMKAISKKHLKRKSQFGYVRSERDILAKMNHPFVVALLACFQTEKQLFLVMQCVTARGGGGRAVSAPRPGGGEGGHVCGRRAFLLFARPRPGLPRDPVCRAPCDRGFQLGPRASFSE